MAKIRGEIGISEPWSMALPEFQHLAGELEIRDTGNAVFRFDKPLQSEAGKFAEFHCSLRYVGESFEETIVTLNCECGELRTICYFVKDDQPAK